MQKTRKPSPVISATHQDRKSPNLSRKLNTSGFVVKPPTPTGPKQQILSKSATGIGIEGRMNPNVKTKKLLSSSFEASADVGSLSLYDHQFLSESERYGKSKEVAHEEFKADWVLQDIVHQQQEESGLENHNSYTPTHGDSRANDFRNSEDDELDFRASEEDIHIDSEKGDFAGANKGPASIFANCAWGESFLRESSSDIAVPCAVNPASQVLMSGSELDGKVVEHGELVRINSDMSANERAERELSVEVKESGDAQVTPRPGFVGVAGAQTPTMLMPPPPDFYADPETYYLQVIALCQAELRNVRAGHSSQSSLPTNAQGSAESFDDIARVSDSPKNTFDLSVLSAFSSQVDSDINKQEDEVSPCAARSGKRRAKSGSFTVGPGGANAPGAVAAAASAIVTPRAKIPSPYATPVKRPQSGGANRPITKECVRSSNPVRNFHNEIEDPELFKIHGAAAFQSSLNKANIRSGNNRSEKPVEKMFATEVVDSLTPPHFVVQPVSHSKGVNVPKKVQPVRPMKFQHANLTNANGFVSPVNLRRNSSEGSITSMHGGIRSPLSAFDDCSVSSVSSISGSTTTSMSTQETQGSIFANAYRRISDVIAGR